MIYKTFKDLWDVYTQRDSYTLLELMKATAEIIDTSPDEFEKIIEIFSMEEDPELKMDLTRMLCSFEHCAPMIYLWGIVDALDDVDNKPDGVRFARPDERHKSLSAQYEACLNLIKIHRMEGVEFLLKIARPEHTAHYHWIVERLKEGVREDNKFFEEALNALQNCYGNIIPRSVSKTVESDA